MADGSARQKNRRRAWSASHSGSPSGFSAEQAERAAKRQAAAAEARRQKEAAARRAAAAEAQRAAAAQEEAKLRHLSSQCRAEVRSGRPISPPVAADKLRAGRCSVRFYNNTTSAVEIHYISSTNKKLTAKVVSGERFGCYVVADSKFTASNTVTTLVSWTTTSEPKQVYFVYDPSRPSSSSGQRKRSSAAAGNEFDDDSEDESDLDTDDEEEESSDSADEYFMSSNQPFRQSTRDASRARFNKFSANQSAADDDDSDVEYATAEEAKLAGNTQIKEGNFKEALECYTRAISLDNTVPAYFGNRGQCYLKLSDWKAALADSMKAVEIDATFGKGWIRAGICHIRMGGFEQAKECFKKAVAIKVCPKVRLFTVAI
eukprot:SAG31_NODE_271_length_18717_cov_8.685949_22_plen_374_part_00